MMSAYVQIIEVNMSNSLTNWAALGISLCYADPCKRIFPLGNIANVVLWRMEQAAYDYRPYALTSRLHNNDAMLGVKTCRAARTCFAGRAHWRSPSQSVCAPGPARRWGMQGFALWLHAWRWCTWRDSFDPQHHGGALLWRHMHMVYLVRPQATITC